MSNCREDNSGLIKNPCQLGSGLSTLVCVLAGWTYDVTADLNQLVQVLCCRIRQEVDSEMCAKTATVPLLHSIHNATFFALETLAHCEVSSDNENLGLVFSLKVQSMFFAFSYCWSWWIVMSGVCSVTTAVWRCSTLTLSAVCLTAVRTFRCRRTFLPRRHSAVYRIRRTRTTPATSHRIKTLFCSRSRETCFMR